MSGAMKREQKKRGELGQHLSMRQTFQWFWSHEEYGRIFTAEYGIRPVLVRPFENGCTAVYYGYGAQPYFRFGSALPKSM